MLNLLLTSNALTEEQSEEAINKLEEILETVKSIGSWYESLGTAGKIIELVFTTLVAAVIVMIILRILSHVFKKFLKSKKNIQLRFLVNIIRIAVVVIGVIWVLTSCEATASVGKMLS